MHSSRRLGEKIIFGKIKPGIGGNRLEDHGRDFVFVFSKRFSDKIDIVEWQGNRQVGERLWNACAVGSTVRKRTAAGLHQKRIGMAMITPVKLDDFVAPGESARQPQETTLPLRCRC